MRSSAMLPVTMFFSPQHLGLGKERKAIVHPPFAINLSACLGRMVALALLPVMLFYYHSLFFLRLCYLIDAIFFPLPPSPCNETVYAVLDCQGRGGVSDFCFHFNLLLLFYLLFPLLSAFLLLSCCPPAAFLAFLFAWSKTSPSFQF